MKLTKKVNALLYVLTLILSLVSFSGFVEYAPTEQAKTTLVIDNSTLDQSRTILYNNACQKSYNYTITFLIHSLDTFLNTQDKNELLVFKNYVARTIGFKAYQLHTKIYSTNSLKQVYQLS